MRKLLKIVYVLMIISIITLMIGNIYAAVDPSKFEGNSGYDTGKIQNIGQNIIQIVSVVGSIASVIVLVVLGLKYMMGSAEEKAEYKKTLLPYIIGAALVFAASGIAGVVFQFTKDLA